MAKRTAAKQDALEVTNGEKKWQIASIFQDGQGNKLRLVATRRKDGKFEVSGFHRLVKSDSPLKQQRSSVSVYPTQEEAEVALATFEKKVSRMGWKLEGKEDKSTWDMGSIPKPQD